MIEAQWKWLNSPCREGDFNLVNYWLEDNLNIVWMPLFRMRQKGLKISYKNFEAQYVARKEEEKAKSIFVSKSGKARITL